MQCAGFRARSSGTRQGNGRSRRIGILTTTDFSILDRIAAREAIPLEEFLVGRDELTQEIIRAGGLLPYSKAHLAGSPNAFAQSRTADTRRLTLIEKIIDRRKVFPPGPVRPGDGIFLRADWRFSHDYFTGMCAHIMHQAFGDDVSLERPEQIIAFQDHLVLADESYPHVKNGMVPAVRELHDAHDHFSSKYPVRSHGKLPNERGAEGICHAILAEQYALPGQVIIGTDSHTPHSGSLGCLAFGAGATDIANSWVTGLIRCRVPDTIRVECVGTLRPGVVARDIVQHLLKTDLIKKGHAIGAAFEFAGPAVEAMSIDERATLTNMVAEMGGFTGFVAPDETTLQYLRERRGFSLQLEAWMHSDPGANYKHVIRIECDTLAPLVASPGDPGNSMPVDELEEHVPVDIAFGGSCTSAKREDFDFYHEVLKWGLDHGLRVPDGTRLVLQFSTLDVREYCRSKGYLETFKAVGAEVVSPGCGACNNCGPGQTTREDQVSITSINRNFPGRSGPGKAWLASPYTVAASALAGHVTSFDALRKSTQPSPSAGAQT
ncbi:3-isopropylmalate dehydratase [Microvirga tunisiensis]|uniref:3-isopropylmalate dehydratase n=1 Tax=Microvirga tunisiensis TaxID=2108360 RepID=A0A5N7MMM2_9HYPH|nr:3-isopropylmalate dehydratase [Microvirga tunisiensis]MPR28302.1 3-isopropylmalate dehydratase [Microvirga tunisiensis]